MEKFRYFLCRKCTSLFKVDYLSGRKVSEPVDSIHHTEYCPVCGSRDKFIIQTLSEEVQRV